MGKRQDIKTLKQHMADKTLISCLSWIKKGYAREFPMTNQDIDKQMAEMMEESEMIEEARKYKEKYEENDDEMVIPNLVKETNVDNQMDEDNLPFGFEDSDEEKEDYKILKDDNLFVAGKIEDEFAAL